MAAPKEIVKQLGSVVGGFTLLQKISAGVLLLVVLGVMIALVTMGAKPGERVLFSGLAQQDAAEVVQRLREMNVVFRLADNGTTIMVSADQVYEVRLNLAGEGLPRGGVVGFEVFDQVGLGTTDFINRLNFQRALQGELARTIRQFQQVQEARVHIATPRESVFIEQAKPVTASISVQLRGREQLSQQQIKSIVNLVASAVPGLSSENITLVDTTGRLLYRTKGNLDTVMSGTQLEFQHQVEETTRRKIESLLEEVVGPNRVRASVTAEIDFNKVNLVEEIFDPEEPVIRSEMLITESSQQGAQARGIPGVRGELAGFAGEAGEGPGEGFQRSNVTRNYEIGRQTRQTQDLGGGISRLSVAVMVDGTYEEVVDQNGNRTMEFSPRSAEEMAHFERLVRNAVGYNAERGDQVSLVSMAFAFPPLVEAEIDPMDRWWELAQWLVEPLLYFLLALLLLFFVVRPLLRLLTAGPRREERGAAGLTPGDLGAQAAGSGEGELAFATRGLSDQERIYRLAQSDPDRAADLVRRWLREES